MPILMVLELDGNLEKGARLWSDLGYLICLRHLFRSTAVTFLKDLFSFTRVQRALYFCLSHSLFYLSIISFLWIDYPCFNCCMDQ